MSERGWPKRGDTMRFLGRNGYEFQLAEALKQFTPGETYTVSDCRVGSWDHSISFEGVDGRFNGVMFEDAALSASDKTGE